MTVIRHPPHPCCRFWYRHMHREGFREWANGGGGNGKGSGGTGGGAKARGSGEDYDEGADTGDVAAAAAFASDAVAGVGRSKAKGGSMDDSKVHIFTSHFFTKLTESKIYDFDVSQLVCVMCVGIDRALSADQGRYMWCVCLLVFIECTTRQGRRRPCCFLLLRVSVCTFLPDRFGQSRENFEVRGPYYLHGSCLLDETLTRTQDKHNFVTSSMIPSCKCFLKNVSLF